ncbi:MAG: DDE-type integrase/transposase/recombinase [Verrucomicrobiales bacterium]
MKLKVVWKPKAEDGEKLELIKLAHAKDPTMGTRQLGRILKRNGYPTARWTVGKMIRYLGLRAIYSKPRTTVPAPPNAKYPYLLHDIEIDSPDQVWAIDITYIPWRRGHVYLTAIIDWHTRAVLAWKVSNTMEVGFCLEALKEAVAVLEGLRDPQHRSRQPIHGDKMVARGGEYGTQLSMDGKDVGWIT